MRVMMKLLAAVRSKRHCGERAEGPQGAQDDGQKGVSSLDDLRVELLPQPFELSPTRLSLRDRRTDLRDEIGRRARR